jgi:FtsP/CotA-like multicopper oxidase with cupredoxin domain
MLRLTSLAACALVPLVLAGPVTRDGDGALPVAQANDNRRPAGRLRRDTLYLDLEVRMARWHPEAPDGPYIEATAIGERGRAPQVPAPMIRVPEGTVIVARLTNGLRDSVLTWHGLATHPARDSLQLHPGRSTTVRFLAGAPGTYLYRAEPGVVDREVRDRSTAGGAFVVDARGAPADDRVFVMNLWSEPVDSVTQRSAFSINGRGWPFTERIKATRGERQRWRLVNGTTHIHPMHLHGFYFRIDARGDGDRDSTFAPDERPLVVTESLLAHETMRMEWVPERAGNWLFHCHIAYHVVPEARYSTGDVHGDHHTGDVTRHMAGLVMGIEVAPLPGEPVEDRSHPRELRLVLQEGKGRGKAPRALGPVLQQGAAPAADSSQAIGTPLLLTRGQATDITVVNHLAEQMTIHWHGIELESWSDGVAGWSGTAQRFMRPIAPHDSFTAHLTLPRAGTFMYHTHLNDHETLTSGLYGAIVVLEPGSAFDPRSDHLFVVGQEGNDDVGRYVVNGEASLPPLVLDAGVEHRLRFAFILPAGGHWVRLLADTTLMQWRLLARDGAELPPARQAMQPAQVRVLAGHTWDYGFRAEDPGEYRLVIGDPKEPMWEREVVVKGR